MAEAITSQVKLDAHSIEPIPEQDKDSTGLQQMWIWAGANIAPINWILGALGIVLGLGLVETVLIVVLGNLIGCAIFAAMTVMGHKTGVNQMVLSRSAFGRRGGYLSSWMQFLMTMGWIGVNTYFPVILAVAILGHFGVKDTFAVKFIVVTILMVIQVGIGVYGFYLIRTFEKYTVPVTLAIMLLMSVLAWTRPGVVNWSLATKLTGAAHFSAITGLVTAIGVGWGISWVTWASDYSRFVPRRIPSRSVFWYSYIGMIVPTVWLAVLGATIASVSQSTDPSKLVTSVFGGVVAVLVMLMVLHGPVATNILNVYFRAGAPGRGRRLRGHPLLPARALVRPELRQLDGRAGPVDVAMGGGGPGRLLPAQEAADRRGPALRGARPECLRGRELGRDRGLRHRAARRLAVRVRPGGAAPGPHLEERPLRRRPVLAGRHAGRRGRLPGRDAGPGGGPGAGGGGAPDGGRLIGGDRLTEA